MLYITVINDHDLFIEPNSYMLNFHLVLKCQTWMAVGRNTYKLRNFSSFDYFTDEPDQIESKNVEQPVEPDARSLPASPGLPKRSASVSNFANLRAKFEQNEWPSQCSKAGNCYLLKKSSN